MSQFELRFSDPSGVRQTRFQSIGRENHDAVDLSVAQPLSVRVKEACRLKGVRGYGLDEGPPSFRS